MQRTGSSFFEESIGKLQRSSGSDEGAGREVVWRLPA